MDHPPACPAHRALVDEALGSDPSDGILERYALEVPACPACRRTLAIRMGVHPGALASSADPLAGMPALLHAVTHEAPRRRTAVWASAAVVVALAAGIAWWLVPTDLGLAPPSPPVAQVQPAPAEVSGQVWAPSPRVVVEHAPDRAPRTHAVTPTADPADNDGIAMAEVEDWPRPPFEDLRTGTLKGTEPTVRAAQLVLSGTAEVGQDMALTVVTSADTPVEVCVDGPERGVVWDGAVSAGRTELTRGGRPVSFAFGAPGRYRFSLSTSAGGAPSCASPVHVVEVEVAR